MSYSSITNLSHLYKKIDHIAIAVKDLELGIIFYRDLLGFELKERRATRGNASGMISAVMTSGDFSFVLIQGTEEVSQVSRYIEEYGPGVQHVALSVGDIDTVVAILEMAGFEFGTKKIASPGLFQVFSKRDKNSGMMIELIERTDCEGFEDANIQDLFNQLEDSGAY